MTHKPSVSLWLSTLGVCAVVILGASLQLEPKIASEFQLTMERCSHHRLHGSTQTREANFRAWHRGDATKEEVLYVLNMLSSRNIPFIDCANQEG